MVEFFMLVTIVLNGGASSLKDIQVHGGKTFRDPRECASYLLDIHMETAKDIAIGRSQNPNVNAKINLLKQGHSQLILSDGTSITKTCLRVKTP